MLFDYPYIALRQGTVETTPHSTCQLIDHNNHTHEVKGPFIIYDRGWAGKKRGWVMMYFLPKKGGHLKILVQKGGSVIYYSGEKFDM
jgi:hypothetical protein